jgi:uncharacterized LabA/DUF88 family protein
MQYKTIILVDGENLVFRYQEMVKSGAVPKESVTHINDCFVWAPEAMGQVGLNDIVRIAYYTTIVGDDTKLEDVKTKISEAEYNFTTISGQKGNGTLVPYVFKKNKAGSKTKSVDVNLTIDALRYAYGTSIEKIVIVSGDGDYIPLLKEIMARGKMVQVYALSNGLNPNIKFNVDDLHILDELFF